MTTNKKKYTERELRNSRQYLKKSHKTQWHQSWGQKKYSRNHLNNNGIGRIFLCCFRYKVLGQSKIEEEIICMFMNFSIRYIWRYLYLSEEIFDWQPEGFLMMMMMYVHRQSKSDQNKIAVTYKSDVILCVLLNRSSKLIQRISQCHNHHP